MKPVLVTTATGQVGQHVAAGLSEAGVPVRALTRDSANAKKLFEMEGLSTSGIEFLQADMRDDTEIRQAVEGCGQAYIASFDSPDQVKIEVNIARIALGAGADHIVKLSSCDAAPTAPFSWARHHFDIEQQIASMTADFSFLRPHYFMQNLFAFANEINATGAISLPTGDGRIGMIDARDIAAVAVKLLQAETPIRRTAELTGPKPVTFTEVASAICAASGTDVEFQPTTDQTYLRRLIEHDNMSPEHAEEIARVYRDVRNGVLDIQTGEVEQITGRPPRSIEQFAIDHAERFKAG